MAYTTEGESVSYSVKSPNKCIKKCFLSCQFAQHEVYLSSVIFNYPCYFIMSEFLWIKFLKKRKEKKSHRLCTKSFICTLHPAAANVCKTPTAEQTFTFTHFTTTLGEECVCISCSCGRLWMNAGDFL